MTELVWVGQPWRVVLRDIGLDERAVLRRAGQPLGLFRGDGSQVTLDDYYRLLDAAEAEAGDPMVAIRAGSVVSAELFDPAYFAAICSPDLHTAICRLAAYMELVGPFRFDVSSGDEGLAVAFSCKVRPDVTRPLGLSQLAFLVALARRATRHHVVPREVVVVGSLDELGECGEFFGCRLRRGDRYAVVFDPVDTTRPFLTHNDEVWNAFEPGLLRNMAEAGARRSTAEEVERALFEFLPSGRTSMAELAHELGLGARTLQRRLAAEGTTWVEVLNRTRERLARHYFASTELSITEVGFLLGFEDPNSLFRAFQRWTGSTPEAWRAANRSPV